MNSLRKSVLQNKMRESSETQMSVAEEESLRMSLFSLEMMDLRPDDGRGCRKYKIIYRKKKKKSLALEIFCLQRLNSHKKISERDRCAIRGTETFIHHV